MNTSTPNLDLALDEAEAERRAKDAFEIDPLKIIKPSLLSANEIVRYVEKTALIFPFNPSKEFLKHASYEGRIGSKAFNYDNGRRTQVDLSSGFLEIKANSIVFVESDITFRLPRYIGLRFNLQIKHVHRGILLGTGPLIDPGFQGKLLIPLHNLTSETYHIPIAEGLIWIEFTKTTYDHKVGHRYGSFPDRKNISDVERWLDKAEECKKTHSRVPIRSSIPLAVEEARDDASTAKKMADDASRASLRVEGYFRRIGWVAIAGSIIGFGALFAAFLSIAYSQSQMVFGYVQEANQRVLAIGTDNTTLKKDVTALQISDNSANFREKLNALENRVIDLERINSRLSDEMAIIQSNSASRNEPIRER